MTISFDVIFALLAILCALLFAGQAAIYGQPNRTHCGAPTRRGGPCRNVIAGGRRCAARHATSWIAGYYTFAVLLLFTSLGILLFQPVTNLLELPPVTLPLPQSS
ncbi:hypothetical protein [Pseudoclavibacter sp. 8L]|uniref:hypothetical protein n=1 Tax=Pseudoclavibacter sp. 8L TaxID=2653162 RepID=UPI0012EF33A7|nr:hypothetical protein [Pseudoclavibacter sp. 8L]VXB29007.1 hypothetical protein PSCLAVI8L_130387 [Pseudoclavibacter sp. 8L]